MAYYRFVSDAFRGLASPVYQQRDFTYIDDIVAGVIAALDRPHRVYNLGNDPPNTLNRMIELIESASGRSVNRDVLPVQPVDVPAIWADISESRRDPSFVPRVSLEEGISRFVGWYRDYAKVRGGLWSRQTV
jgi:UDP-glucuronate 4-epimerase